MGYPILKEKSYSTVQVARMLGISWSTLHRWIVSKKIRVPPVQTLGRVQVRFWTETDLEAARKYKAEHYRKKPNRRIRKKTVSAK
jgi:predicted site-specific integrase-resolvase